MIILPGHPLFDLTLATATPPGWRKSATEDVAMVADSATGLLRPATRKELDEYCYGGEYGERLSAIGEPSCDDY